MVPVHSILLMFCALTVGLTVFSVEFEQSPVAEHNEPMVAETPQEAPVETRQPVEEIKPEGIDTVSLEDPQGNWLFKKIWWERAETLYGKIREAVTSIWESRTTFFTQRNDLDKKILDPFYMSIGMGQGELDTALAELADFYEQKREHQADLTGHELDLYETLEKEKEAFDQLRLDVEAITHLDRALDDALNVLMEQINKARQLEKQAWESFREIAHVLNDVKARELYYVMDGISKNIKSINVYLERDFKSHFSRLSGEVKKHTDSIVARMQSLKEKGIDLKKRMHEDEALAAQESAENAVDEEDVKPKPKKLGWGAWMLSLPIKAWDWIVSVISMPFSWLFGGKK